MAGREEVDDQEGAYAQTVTREVDCPRVESPALLPDQRTGALTQIFQEHWPDGSPEIIERVVNEIDSVVMSVRFSGWQTSREGDRAVKFELRNALKKFGIEPTGDLFDKAYAYVAEYY